MESETKVGIHDTYAGGIMRSNTNLLTSVNDESANGFKISELRKMRSKFIVLAYENNIIKGKDKEDILYDIIEHSIIKIRRKQDLRKIELAERLHFLQVNKDMEMKLLGMNQTITLEKRVYEGYRKREIKRFIQLLSTTKILASYFTRIYEELIWEYNGEVACPIAISSFDSILLSEEEEFPVLIAQNGIPIFQAKDKKGNELLPIDISSKGLKLIIEMENIYQRRPDNHYESALYNEIRERFLSEGFFQRMKTIKTDEAVFLFDLAGLLDIIGISKSGIKEDKKDYIKVQLKKTQPDIFGNSKG